MKRVVLRSFRLVPLLAIAAWLCAIATLAPAALALGPDDGGPGAAARIVRSFIDYTRWPSQANPATICVAGPAVWSGQLDGMVLGDGRRTTRKAVSVAAVAGSGCNVVYMGRVEQRAAQAAFATVRGKGVLTIAENDPQCRSQAMFCLLPGRETLGFAINIDAVSRSGLRIDPRVLRMASGNAR
jgi:hypothetical protein